ncbi:MAG: hypothetical protein M3547_04520, partial [Acidobacteriota bacterium]|nr:hypothetical protein [Acidobacteriota bacterium]
MDERLEAVVRHRRDREEGEATSGRRGPNRLRAVGVGHRVHLGGDENAGAGRNLGGELVELPLQDRHVLFGVSIAGSVHEVAEE